MRRNGTAVRRVRIKRGIRSGNIKRDMMRLCKQRHPISAAPYSTFDPDTPDGSAIQIEERDPEEIACGFGKRTAPEGIHFYNPAFDVTPAELIAGFITERGILHPPFGTQEGA